jgi:hypothetical protein
MPQIYYYIEINPLTHRYEVYPIEARYKNLQIYKLKNFYTDLNIAQTICNNFNLNIDLY